MKGKCPLHPFPQVDRIASGAAAFSRQCGKPQITGERAWLQTILLSSFGVCSGGGWLGIELMDKAKAGKGKHEISAPDHCLPDDVARHF